MCLVPIETEDDILIAIRSARLLLNELSFSPADIQKVLVCVSELTHNILDHADGNGFFLCEIFHGGVRIKAIDHGKGMIPIDVVLEGKPVSDCKGLGLGLAGARRLMDDFQVETSKRGTTIIATKRSGS